MGSAASVSAGSSQDRHAWASSGPEDLGDGIYRIPLPLPGDALTAVNVYALTGPEGADLIDSGMAIAAAREALTAALAGLGLALGDIRNFFITHIHHDHYTLAVQLRTTLAGKISLGEGERVNLEAIRAAQQDRTPPGFLTMLPSLGAAPVAAKLKAAFGAQYRQEQDNGLATWGYPDRWLAGGTALDLGARTLNAIETPGHTRGHVVYHDAGHGLLFAGDHVLPHITPSIGFQPAITRSALSQYLSSLQLMLTLPDSRLLPAHGPVTGSTHTRVKELLDHHEARLAQILQAASAGPVTAYDVAQVIPWTRRQRKFADLDMMSQILAIGETAAHLEVLIARGQLARAVSEDGVESCLLPAPVPPAG